MSLTKATYSMIEGASVNVVDYGAIGDGSADDTAAIQAAATEAALTGNLLTFAPGKIFKIIDTVIIPAGVGIDMRGAQIMYAGTTDKPAVVVGVSGTANQSASGRQMQFLGLDIRFKINPLAAELSDTNFVGIRFWNLRACSMVNIAYVMGFTRNIEFISDQTLGSAYNHILLGRSINSFEHMVFRTSGASGFTTEMLISGGSLINSSDYPSTLGSKGVLVTWNKVASNRDADALVFNKPCFELGERAGAGDRIAVYFDGAGHNCKFNEVRWEGCDGPFMYADGGATLPSEDVYVHNNQVSFTTISGARQASTPITETNRAIGSRVFDAQTVDSAFGGVLQTRNIVDCVKAGGASGEKSLTGEWYFMSSGSPTPVKRFASTLVSLKPDYVELAEIGSSIAIGVAVDTRVRKSFVVKVNQKAGYEGRLLLMCFDANGRQLTSSGTGEDLLLGYWNYINSKAASSLPYSTGFGGSWRNLSKAVALTAQSFRVASNVAYVIVAVSNNAGGDGVVRFSGFDILIPPTGARIGNDATSFYSVIDGDAMPISSALPNTGGSTYGKHYRGELIGNSGATAGQPFGWACSNSGWVAPAWAITTAYLVDDVRANGGNVYICTTAGTSAGAGGPSGTGTGIVDGTAVWNYLAPLATFVTGANLV